MTNSGNEVTDRKGPFADAFKPHQNAIHFLIGDRKEITVLVDEIISEGSPQSVTDGYAANASPESGKDGEGKIEMAVIAEIAREREECFIRDRQADDAEHQQHEQSRITIFDDPMKNRVHLNSTNL